MVIWTQSRNYVWQFTTTPTKLPGTSWNGPAIPFPLPLDESRFLPYKDILGHWDSWGEGLQTIYYHKTLDKRLQPAACLKDTTVTYRTGIFIIGSSGARYLQIGRYSDKWEKEEENRRREDSKFSKLDKKTNFPIIHTLPISSSPSFLHSYPLIQTVINKR